MKIDDLYISSVDQVVIRRTGKSNFGYVGTVVAGATEDDFLGRDCVDWSPAAFSPLMNEDGETIASVLDEIKVLEEK